MVRLSDKPSRKSTQKTYQEHPGTVPEIYPFFYPAPGVPPEGASLRAVLSSGRLPGSAGRCGAALREGRPPTGAAGNCSSG